MLRKALRSTPILRRVLANLYSRVRKSRFSSNEYWEERYRKGGNSGVGSYGVLAEFKAEVLNGFIQERGIATVVEFGCGDGNQLCLLNCPKYVGLDVSPRAIELCCKKFSSDRSKRFVLFDAASFSPAAYRSDLALSLDVIFHLVEDNVFSAYMAALFDTASEYVIIYSDDRDLGLTADHVRHRAFSKWIRKNRPEWQLLEHIPNRFPFDERTGLGSFADFRIYQRRGPA
jgi:hypothetical protein